MVNSKAFGPFKTVSFQSGGFKTMLSRHHRQAEQPAGRRNGVREQRLTAERNFYTVDSTFNVANKFLSIIHRSVCGQSRKVNDSTAPDCEHLMSMFESSHKH